MDGEQIREKNKLPVPLDSGILYTVVALYYVYVSQLIVKFQFNDTVNLIISQVMFFLAPPLILALIRGYDIKKTFRLKAPRPLEVLLMLLISPVMVIAGFCAGYIALVGVKAVFGRVLISGEIGEYMNQGIFVSLLLVAVLPAICEEFLFRGLIQRGMEGGLGAGWAIFLSGLLFGLFHFDFQRLAAQTLIGLIAAYVTYRTGSIFNGMILHFMNNGLLTLLSNYATQAAEGNQVQVVTDPFETPEFVEMASSYGMSLTEFLGIMSVVLAVVLVCSLVVIFGLLLIVRTITSKTVEKPEKVKGSAKGLLLGLPGLLLIVIVYVSLGLVLVNNPLGRQILVFFGFS